jgi:hypothetical protein
MTKANLGYVANQGDCLGREHERVDLHSPRHIDYDDGVTGTAVERTAAR